MSLFRLCRRAGVRMILEDMRCIRSFSTRGGGSQGEKIDIPVITKTSGKIGKDSASMEEGEWVNWVQSLEPMEQERELHKVKRAMGSFYTLGRYGDALNSALKLERAVDNTIGRLSPVYASCLNNIALMNKMLGHSDVAIDKYTEALQVYESTVGKEHSSYASALSNVGILYRSMAETLSGMSRLQHLNSAEQALQEALDIRTALAPGKNMAHSRDALNSAMNLAMVRRMLQSESEEGLRECEKQLRRVLLMCRQLCGDSDSMTAVVLSNLGVFLKGTGQFEEARAAYDEALDIRSKTLGDSHPDTVISMHNLAELYVAMNEQEKSEQLQNQILAILGTAETGPESSASVKSPSSAAPSSGLIPGKAQPWDDEEKETKSDAAVEEEVQPPVTFATRKKKQKKK